MTYARPIPRVTIDGTDLRCLGWDVHMGSFGSIGNVEITTNRQQLREAGIELIGLRESNRVIPIEVSIEQNGKQPVLLFGGGYDANAVTWSEEIVRIQARDWSKTMIEFQSALGANQPDASKIARDLAVLHGLTPIVSKPPTAIGVTFNNTSAVNMTNQSHWSMIWKLALKCGFEVRVTPKRELYFGPPPATTPVREMVWRPPPSDQDCIPINDLETKNNVHESKTFTVQVISYDHSRGQITRGQAVVLGSDQLNNSGSAFYKNGKIVASISNKFMKSGTYWAAAGSSVGAQLTNELEHHPVYRFYSSGLTPAAANQLALAYAKDIAKREYIVKGWVTGDPQISPHDRLLLTGYKADGVTKDDMEGYGGKQYSIVQVVHRFRMPQGPGVSTEGYKTEITAVAIPPGESDNVAGAFSNWF